MKSLNRVAFATAFCFVLAIGSAQTALAVVFTFDSDDFLSDPQFSDVQTFHYEIDVDEPIIPGGVYDNPTLNSVVYSVNGSLAPNTPSEFSGFMLERTIGGSEFYAQGSSLRFNISAAADLSDGLQMSELSGGSPVFVFNGREVGTGRYHPSLFELNSDGTGRLRNSNNFGGINPGSQRMVDVQVGQEYVTALNFPLTLTIAPAIIPEPSNCLLLGFTLLGAATRRRRFPLQ